MVDHYVDRLGVEAWQHVKLTSTNSPIGVIRFSRRFHLVRFLGFSIFLWFGGYSTSETLDSIPNSTVKHRSADGTAS